MNTSQAAVFVVAGFFHGKFIIISGVMASRKQKYIMLIAWTTHIVQDTLFAAEATVLSIPVQLHDTHNPHMSVPHSLLGVFLDNVLVHMYCLIGGVGVHWYCIISRASAGLGPKRLLPEIIVGSMECVVYW